MRACECECAQARYARPHAPARARPCAVCGKFLTTPAHTFYEGRGHFLISLPISLTRAEFFRKNANFIDDFRNFDRKHANFSQMNGQEIQTQSHASEGKKTSASQTQSQTLASGNSRQNSKNASGAGSIPRPASRRRQRQKARRAACLENKKETRRREILSEADRLRNLASAGI